MEVYHMTRIVTAHDATHHNLQQSYYYYRAYSCLSLHLTPQYGTLCVWPRWLLMTRDGPKSISIDRKLGYVRLPLIRKTQKCLVTLIYT